MAGFQVKLSTLREPTFFSALLSFYGKLIYAGESTCLKVKMATGFDEQNGEEGAHKQKIKLSKQCFRHFEQQAQGMTNFKGEFWVCFYELRGNIFVINRSMPTEEKAQV